MTFTPGPWHVDGVYGEGQLRQQIMGADRLIASIWQHFDCNNKALQIATDRANACLIAAAPELLEACKAVLRVCDGASFPDSVHLSIAEVRALDRAVRKAEGREL